MSNKLFLALAAGLLFSASSWAQRERNHNFDVAKNLEIFNAIYKNVDMVYVDTLNADTLMGRAIRSMLSSLDPFTDYYSEENEKELKQMATGKFAGMGALIHYHEKEERVRVAEPYEGSPAQLAGVKAGDIILSVDDKDIHKMSTTQVSAMLLGEPNTSFVLKVKRIGGSKPLTFKITRKTIQVSAVPYHGMLRDSDVGYLYLSDFTEDAAKEMRRAIADLKKNGAKKLVIDLRDNGGGQLDEAVKIVNFFVPKNKQVVSMRGKTRTFDYKTEQEPIDVDIPITVLVNGYSASAAEIVAGALQDFDRAVIVGNRTYGKGLVQSVMSMPYNTALKVTTGKYYIPSGRCIQAYDYKNLDRNGNPSRLPDSLTNVFKTAGGREVRDGGGITPDVVSMRDSMQADNIVYYLMGSNLILDYACQYVLRHKQPVNVDNFTISDQEFEEFVKLVAASDFTYDKRSERMLESLKKLMKSEGYYEGAVEEFAALEAKLNHDLEYDLRRAKKYITQLLSYEIVKYHHYARGGIIFQISAEDRDIDVALDILSDGDHYRKLLKP